ncbi:hypothetical protein [Cohnella sp. GCM10027633]|uniref:hypothetical protein n=1 Tax=unclassified Cohnella TaxID=2636738 RepID=UPI00362EF680
MIRYGDEKWTELRFEGLRYEAVRRDNQWVDVTLRVETAEETPLPLDLIDFAILAVCTHRGDPIQLATLDEDCDSEYQLTDGEKQQIEAYIRSEDVQRAIRLAASAE